MARDGKTDTSDQPMFAWQAIRDHFGDEASRNLISLRRQFGNHLRADLQAAIDARLSSLPHTLLGVFQHHEFFKMGTANLLNRQAENAIEISPPQYQDIDVGEDQSVACISPGLWFATADDVRFMLFVSTYVTRVNQFVIVEITTSPGAAAHAFCRRFLEEIEAALRVSRYYRGKTLSFDGASDFSGKPGALCVHRLPLVARESVILDEATMRHLDENVFLFDRHRAGLKALGQSTRKGILLYGPPGTGKTHAIRYVATNLPTHTTLLITADQVAQLPRYMDMARTLQPSIVVIEDVDLIGRAREEMQTPGVESLLNMLLNEMDGLRDDSDILFILTTNRPEQIEAALASRPGRVDQAIEIPLPDEGCRDRLIALYGRLLIFDPGAKEKAVAGTAGVSAAFVKEFVRRLAQLSLGRDDGVPRVGLSEVDMAIEAMMGGGRIGRSLLGAGEAGRAKAHPVEHPCSPFALKTNVV